MKPIYILIMLICIIAASVVIFIQFPTDEAGQQKAAHDAFLGPPPATSKPYNIMDYTKPAP